MYTQKSENFTTETKKKFFKQSSKELVWDLTIAVINKLVPKQWNDGNVKEKRRGMK